MFVDSYAETDYESKFDSFSAGYRTQKSDFGNKNIYRRWQANKMPYFTSWRKGISYNFI